MRQIVFIIIALGLALAGRARDPQPEADAWLTNGFSMPEAYRDLETAGFSALKAEAVARKIQITWRPESAIDSASIVASADAPGHWPARDWRTFAMRRSGPAWQIDVPTDSVDVPLIYFAVGRDAKGRVASPMRVALPRDLGLEEPSRLFWPFIEGFEQGLEGWRVLGGGEARTGLPARSGQNALAIAIPAGKRSVTVVTTRLRGWFLEEHGATGIGLWLRTRSGSGQANLALLANAFSTNQIVAGPEAGTKVTDKWARATLLFSDFPRLPLGELDLVSLKLAGKPGMEFFIDDVHLIGRWRLE